jgi:hypothetical protein
MMLSAESSGPGIVAPIETVTAISPFSVRRPELSTSERTHSAALMTPGS